MIFGFLTMKKMSVENMYGLYHEVSFLPTQLALPILDFITENMLAPPPSAGC
jgi:hypothetical protein